MVHSPAIVVANDDDDFLALIRELLEERGYPQVTTCGTGAYKVIQQLQPDLIVIDITITNASVGWSTLDKVKLNPKTAPIPIILCSTDPRLPLEKAAWLREKGIDFLEKPFELDDLIKKVVGQVGPPLDSDEE